MEIAVVGAGYVGLTTAACLAHLGHRVVCADVLEDRVEALGEGRLPIVEDGLEELVANGLATGRLEFVLGAPSAAKGAEFVFLCVPTPQGDDGSADISSVEKVVASIAPVLQSRAIVVNKATVPVGATRLVSDALGRDDVTVVSNPEFLSEGSAVHNFLHPQRIVVGTDDRAAGEKVVELFAGIRAPVVITDPATAETIKYASNAFLATKVSFANAVAAICEEVGADVEDVIRGMGYDSRIGSEFLQPGPGWGGSCLPKDSSALVKIAEEAGYDFGPLKGAIAVNDAQRERVIARVLGLAGRESLAGLTVAVWGLTFKAGTDDLRGSSALYIAREMAEMGARVRAFDPTRRSRLEAIEVVADPYEACDDADVLAVLTEWPEFRWLDLGLARIRMRHPRLFDARGIIDPAGARRAGFSFGAVGRS